MPGKYIPTKDLEIIESVPLEKRVRQLINKDSAQEEDAHSEKDTATSYIEYPYNVDALLMFLEDNTWHSACCHVKSQVVCGDFDIVSGDKEKEPDAEHKKLQDFLDKPNKNSESIYELFTKFWLDYESTGNAYFELVKNRMNKIGEIYHIPAQRVRKAKILPGYFQVKGTMVTKEIYFKVFGDEKDKADTTASLIHLKSYYSGSSYYGLPDFIPALGAMYLDRNAVIYNNKFFDNGGMLGMIISVLGGKLSKEARVQLRTMLQDNAVGAENAHRIALLDNLGDNVKIEIDKLTEGVKEASFHMMRRDNRDEIIAAHHVPPKMLGITTPGQMGASNDAWGQMQIFKIVEVQPSQRKFEHFLNNFIVEQGLGIKNWKLKFKEMEIEDSKEKSERLYGDLEHGIIDAGEAREERGLPEQEEQDEPEPMKIDDVLETLTKIEKYLKEN